VTLPCRWCSVNWAGWPWASWTPSWWDAWVRQRSALFALGNAICYTLPSLAWGSCGAGYAGGAGLWRNDHDECHRGWRKVCIWHALPLCHHGGNLAGEHCIRTLRALRPKLRTGERISAPFELGTLPLLLYGARGATARRGPGARHYRTYVLANLVHLVWNGC